MKTPNLKKLKLNPEWVNAPYAHSAFNSKGKPLPELNTRHRSLEDARNGIAIPQFVPR